MSCGILWCVCVGVIVLGCGFCILSAVSAIVFRRG